MVERSTQWWWQWRWWWWWWSWWRWPGYSPNINNFILEAMKCGKQFPFILLWQHLKKDYLILVKKDNSSWKPIPHILAVYLSSTVRSDPCSCPQQWQLFQDISELSHCRLDHLHNLPQCNRFSWSPSSCWNDKNGPEQNVQHKKLTQPVVWTDECATLI